MALRRPNRKESLELTEYLLRHHGVSPNKYEGENVSPMWETVGFHRGIALHEAFRTRNIEAARLLLSHGADPRRNKQVRSSEILHSSVYDEAEQEGEEEFLTLVRARRISDFAGVDS